MQNCVIVTAVDHTLFDHYHYFRRSIYLNNANIKVKVFDVGLLPHQIEIVKKSKNTELQYFNFPNYQMFGVEWIKFLKPFLIDQIDDNIVLWIDVDTILLNDISGLIDLTKEKLFFTNDRFAPKSSINDGKLYETFDTKQSGLTINNGVLGFLKERDYYIIDEWIKRTVEFYHLDLLKYVTCYDQGIFLFVIEHLKLTNLIEIDSVWNSTPKYCSFNSVNFYEVCKKNHKNKSLIHFAGLFNKVYHFNQYCLINFRYINNEFINVLHAIPKIKVFVNCDKGHNFDIEINEKIDNDSFEKLFGLDYINWDTA